ncbi:primosomal protein N' [Idiomarina tyrosinivorans]|uniref:Replication restart protein PriA n=1 Tax=Idiomarina tyrosinivorans TaxID=1445662 RepID=A0A432ZPZ8_9GAMM|nr:primosomal protein N' [Idiomarina tyrosinivorans]RUO79921.1 primosomal protein N' [Idiomarina tyrosinivorans]
MQASLRRVRLALPVPLRQYFDYEIPEKFPLPAVGARLRVPFGRRNVIGFCVAQQPQDSPADMSCKAISEIIDSEPLLPAMMWQLCEWAADYYHHPLGDVLQQAIPALLRKGEAAQYASQRVLAITAAGTKVDSSEIARAPKRQQLLQQLQQQQQLAIADAPKQQRQPLIDAGWAEQIEQVKAASRWRYQRAEQPLTLNQQQALAVSAINQAKGAETFLLDGVTGSGKTEVYLQAIEQVLERQQQVLVLVPEIGLTPQTLARFRNRFAVPIVMLHSALTDRERLDAWLDASNGSAALVIGTRSAIFTPFKSLGLIVVDEEHDLSFKQQEGFRYSARDLASKRGQLEQVPLVLGSATPSFETLNNAIQQRFRWLPLNSRAGGAQPVKQQLIDLKQQRMNAGLSEPLLEMIKNTLAKHQQVLLFLNRRGFAPALMCHECGWLASCQRCDAYYTVHHGIRQLHCHHCGAHRPIPKQCPQCSSLELMTQGIGTEQVEQTLSQLFPETSVLRIDRDSTRRKGSLDTYLKEATDNKHGILVGTQMLAKGHHFPQVSLVALLDVDGALYSGDFRAAERLGQLYTQVAGRAGRAQHQGYVVLQTHHPEHELLQDLLNNGYSHFALSAMTERQQAQLPPFAHLALFRAEALQLDAVHQALQDIANQFPAVDGVNVLGPMPALMERRAGKYRMQLLIHCTSRALRYQVLNHVLARLAAISSLKQVRWNLDIDPQDFS